MAHDYLQAFFCKKSIISFQVNPAALQLLLRHANDVSEGLTAGSLISFEVSAYADPEVDGQVFLMQKEQKLLHETFFSFNSRNRLQPNSLILVWSPIAAVKHSTSFIKSVLKSREFKVILL